MIHSTLGVRKNCHVLLECVFLADKGRLVLVPYTWFLFHLLVLVILLAGLGYSTLSLYAIDCSYSKLIKIGISRIA